MVILTAMETRYYNMRIRTIKRNTNFLIKLLDNTYAESQNVIESDIAGLMSREKKVQKRWDDFTVSTARRDQVRVNIFSVLLQGLVKSFTGFPFCCPCPARKRTHLRKTRRRKIPSDTTH